MRRIVQNGHCLHLVIEDASPEAVALVEAILDADQAVRKEGVTADEILAAHDAIASCEAAWCAAHGFKLDCIMAMALSRLSDKLCIVEARHATA